MEKRIVCPCCGGEVDVTPAVIDSVCDCIKKGLVDCTWGAWMLKATKTEFTDELKARGMEWVD